MWPILYIVCPWQKSSIFSLESKGPKIEGFVVYLNPYLQILENSSRNFSEIFIFWVVTQAVLLENSSIQIMTETL